jgi:hypothetical protein
VRAARLGLGVLGIAAIVWGGWLLRDDGIDRLQSTGLWLAGVVVLHDAVLAPLVIMLGVVATKVIPRRHHAIAAVAFLVWGTLTLAVANVLSGLGGKPGMDSLLHRPYVSAWLVLTGLVLAAAIVAAMMKGRHRPTDA